MEVLFYVTFSRVLTRAEVKRCALTRLTYALSVYVHVCVHCIFSHFLLVYMNTCMLLNKQSSTVLHVYTCVSPTDACTSAPPDICSLCDPSPDFYYMINKYCTTYMYSTQINP